MKKGLLYSLIILLVVVFSSRLSYISAQTFSGGGAGTSQNPWKLTNNADIDTLANWVASSSNWSADKYFQLLNNIGSSMNPVTTMIGSNNRPFMGKLQGAGYSIYVNYTGSYSQMALFRYASNCEVHNLTIDGTITFTSTSSVHIAGLIACLENTSTSFASIITGCKNRASITGTDRVGGLIAMITGPGTIGIVDCSNTGNITLSNGNIHYGGIAGTIASGPTVTIYNCYSDSCSITFSPITTSDTIHIGGIAGCINPSNTTITNCYNRSNIKSSGGVAASNIVIGGIAALNSANSLNNVSISNCQNYATISANGSNVAIGGIIGENYSTSTISISNCQNYDTISANSTGMGSEIKVGGILGNNLGTTTIKHCTNRGMTNTTGGEIKAGGIAGDNDTITAQIFIDSCYNYANHISNCSYYLTHVGGILGDNGGTFTITGCRNSGNILGYGTSMHYDLGGIVGDNMGTGTITRSTNIGNIYTTTTGFSSTISVGGIIGFGNMNIIVNNCHNAGLVQGVGNVGGIIGSKYNSGSINNNLNVGCVLLNNDYPYNSKGAIAGSSTGGMITNNFYDMQMCVYGGINNVDVSGTTPKLTTELTGSSITLGAGFWIYTSDIYPMLFNDSISQVAASPAFLDISFAPNFDKHNNVTANFDVSTLNSINWTSSNTNIVSISGTSADLVSFGSCNIYPNLGNIRRTVPIITVPKTYLLVTRPDTIGQGITSPDSIKILGNVVITATPAPCYEFVAWIDKNRDTISKNKIETITFSRDTILIAVFTKSTNKTLKISKTPPEGGNVSGGKTNVPCGTLDTIIAIPNPCYKFLYWVDSATKTLISTDAEYVLAIESDMTLIANFEAMPDLFIKTKPEPEYAGTTTGGGVITCSNPKIIISAVPEDCYKLVRWIDSASQNTISINAHDTLNAYVNLHNDATLIAIFELDSITINTSIYPTSAAGTTSINDLYTFVKVVCGDNIIISATPKNECYRFVNWTSAGVIVSEKIKDTLSFKQNTFLIANFVLDTFNLTLSANPSNFGDFIGDGPVICGNGSVIEAISNECKRFINWTDAQTGEIVSNEKVFAIILEKDRHLIANFTTDSFNLSLSSSPRNAGLLTKAGIYECGTGAIISATPSKDCYTFSYWENTKTGEKVYETEANIEMFSDMDFVAHWATLDSFYLTLESNPSNVNIILSGAGLYSNCDSVASIDITILNNKCITFINWTDKDGNVISEDLNTNIFVKYDSLLIANFIINSLAVSLNPLPEEAGTVNETQYYKDTLLCNDLFEFRANANKGWRFVSWTDSITGQVISTQEIDYLYVSEDTKLIANFVEFNDSVTITLIPNPSGGGILTGGGRYPIDAIVQLEATHNQDFAFINWTENGVLLNKNTSFTITASRNMTIYGNFTDANSNYYIVSLHSNIDDACVLTGGGAYSYDAMATISAIPNSNYQFRHWQTLDGEIISNDINYSFKVTSDTDLVAHFYLIEYAVTIYALPSYMGKIEGGTTGIYEKGNTLGLQAISTEPEYYAFTYWSNEYGDTLAKTTNFQLVVQSDTTIIAHFVDKIGIAEYDQDNIYIYPNPAINTLNIVFENANEEDVEISITNILGDKKAIFNTSDINTDISKEINPLVIDVSDFPSGMYIIYFNFSDRTVIKKVIKH
ncbi:MAG: InlB B-repeat-containing protein [Bacteroidetes bacterium]|nr:InlB B-repeat-containing protein [Bacteroidota bacterium]